MEPDIRKREAAGQLPAIVLDERTAAEGGPIEISRAANPMADTTLGGLAEGVEITGPDRFPPTIVMLPVGPGTLDGIDERTVHVFRLDVGARTWHPVWDSGVNVQAGYAWARVRRPGRYVPVGLPRDQVLLALVRALAHHRQLLDDADPGYWMEQSRRVIDSFLDAPEAEVENLRFYLAQLESQSTAGALSPTDFESGRGATRGAFPLPGHAGLAEIRDRIRDLDLLAGGLPEERLLTPPERLRATSQPWPLRSGAGTGQGEPTVSGASGQLWKDLLTLP